MSTDPQILQDVTEELQWDAALDASLMTVAVKDGFVTIAGKVGAITEQWEAEQVSQCVLGVRGVTIHLDVVPSLHRSDEVIAQAAEDLLSSLSYLVKDSIRVRVDDAWMYLSGKVTWDYQRRHALDALRAFAGVRGITDSITLEGEFPASTAQRDIERALERQFGFDARVIRVTVDGSHVLLSGRVRNYKQRELAREAVWNVRGVRSVTDTLT
jgi:osmotically-inducible protein OsmY